MPKQSMRFKPHMNTALGKYYHTKEDYLSDMKKGGFEPYTGSAPQPERKSYTPSKWARDMQRTIVNCTDSKGRAHVSGIFRRELEKRGVVLQDSNTRVDNGMNSKQGGFK